MIKIDDNIPYPTTAPGARKYRLRDLEIGQSFAVDVKAALLSKAAWAFGKYHGRKFVVRSVEENGKKMARCWRIA